MPHLGCLSPWKTRYPSYGSLGRPQCWSGWGQKISPPPGFDPRTVQPVASRYTDWAILVHGFCEFWSFCNGVIKYSVLLGCDVQCCVSTAWSLWGMCYLNLQQLEPLDSVMQRHIPEHWNHLWILSALYTLFFICYKILVQAGLLFNVHPKFWYGQSSCFMLTWNSVTSSLVYCWPKILVRAVHNVDPKFWCKHSFCVM